MDEIRGAGAFEYEKGEGIQAQKTDHEAGA